MKFELTCAPVFQSPRLFDVGFMTGEETSGDSEEKWER